MKIGVLGTGTVGESIATALVQKGNEVCMGSRTAGNEKGVSWAAQNGTGATAASFAEAAARSEVLFICLNAAYVLEALRMVDPAHTAGKILIDLTNPLDFSQGGTPPAILESFQTVSAGEQIQHLLREARVVKTLNTVNYKLMVDARQAGEGQHHLFLSGDDVEAKAGVKKLLAANFYWNPDCFIDLGGIHTARAVEAMVPFWVLVYRSMGTPLFNFRIVR